MDFLAQAPLTLTLGKAGLGAGTTTTYTTTTATAYAIKGKAFSKAAVTNGATPTLDRNTGAAFAPIPASMGAVVLFAYDAAGVVRCAQGQAQSLDAAGNFFVAPQFPIVPDTDCPFGYLVVKAGATAVGNYVFGVSNLSAVTGVTQTFVDLVNMPDRPQIA